MAVAAGRHPQKKLRSGQFGLSRRRLKRPRNYLLSTGNCNCQASEEERMSNLLARAGTEHPAFASAEYLRSLT
jgi:hypothetical protein